MRVFQKTDLFDNVGSGKFSTLTLDPSGHYFGLGLAFDNSGTPSSTAEIIADVDSVEVEIAQKGVGDIQVVKASAEALFAYDAYKNAGKTDYTQAGVLPISFLRDKLPLGVNDMFALGIGTLDLRKISVTVNFKTNGGFTTTSVTLYRDHDQDINQPLGTYPVLLEDERELNTTGQKPLRDLPKQTKGAAHLSMHVNDGAGAISEIAEVRLGTQKIFQNVDSTVHARLAHDNGRTLSTGIWSLDFQRSRDWLSIDNTADFEVEIDWTTAPGAFTILHDMIHGIA